MEEVRDQVGIVLSGGGSRGAYEVGVIQFLRDVVSKRLGRHVTFDVIAGTSVGAINGVFLAATAMEPENQAAQLASRWRALQVEELMPIGARDVLRTARLLLGGEPPPLVRGALSYGGIVQSGGLERFVIEAVPWRGIRRSLSSGHLSALSVTATHVGTGRTVKFVDSAEPLPPRLHRDPNVLFRRVAIGPRHALASAAIPLLFPSVRIEGAFYVDGGLRQNTPLASALRLGADRLLVISLRKPPEATELHSDDARAVAQPLALAGKALNALLLDHTQTDLGRLERINDLLSAGTAVYGANFADQIASQAGQGWQGPGQACSGSARTPLSRHCEDRDRYG